MAERLDDQPAHEPGWKPPLLVPMNKNGECHRQAIACITGVHPFFIPWCSPDRKDWTYQDWEDAWVGVIEMLGYDVTIPWGNRRVREILDAGLLDGRYWLAVVRGMTSSRNNTSGDHAIVMHGRKLHFDCNNTPGSGNGRTQAPHRFCGAWILTPR